MTDGGPVADRGRLSSPCIGICRMHPCTGLCEGCLRTIEEIAQWSAATEDEKRQMWAQIARRRDALS